MPPSNAMENDKKRLRNQFTKDERARLLTIMTEYGPLLDDKNISILSRKEIWEIIENKFNENGHSGRTSAQLKKYWQNYKYHSKRTKIIHKEVPKPLSPMTKHMVRMLAQVNPEEWAQYDVAVNSGLSKKTPRSSKASPSNLNTENLEGEGENSCSPLSKTIRNTPPRRSLKSSGTEAPISAHESKMKRESTESNVVVSTTEVPGSSVTVSVICPEVTSKARTIFLKRNLSQDKLGSILQSSYHKTNNNNNNNIINPNENERRIERSNLTDDFSPDLANNSSDIFNQEVNDSLRTYNRRLNIVGIIPQLKKESRNQTVTNKSEVSKDVIKEIKDYNLMETLGSVSATNGRSVLNTSINEDVECSDFVEMLQKLETVKESLNRRVIIDEIIRKIENTDNNFEGESNGRREMGLLRYMMNSEKDSPRKDSLWLKLYLKLIQKVGAVPVGANRHPEILRKFEPTLIPRISSSNKINEENDETSGESEQDDREKRMEIDELENDNAKLRVRRVSLMTTSAETDQFQQEIKVEAEEESEVNDIAQDSINATAGENRTTISMNSLVEVKLQCAKSELDHQIKLQKLEMEEKELRVRIAEMTIQETRLRIQSLIEDRRRATELHELRLAQMAAEKARSETEHAARLDASCIATAEGRARISSIERDRERSENFYQMQLRCMSAGTTANVNCSLKCKQYQQ